MSNDLEAVMATFESEPVLRAPRCGLVHFVSPCRFAVTGIQQTRPGWRNW